MCAVTDIASPSTATSRHGCCVFSGNLLQGKASRSLTSQ